MYTSSLETYLHGHTDVTCFHTIDWCNLRASCWRAAPIGTSRPKYPVTLVTLYTCRYKSDVTHSVAQVLHLFQNRSDKKSGFQTETASSCIFNWSRKTNRQIDAEYTKTYDAA